MRILLLIILTINLSFAEDLTVKGKLLGADGNAMEKATVKIYGDIDQKEPRHLVTVEKDGSFEFEVTKDKIHWVEFSGVDHLPIQDYFIPSTYDDELEFKIMLQEIFPAKQKKAIFLIVKNGGEANYESLELTKDEDGVYRTEYDNPHDTLIYQLFGHLDEQRATNGSMSDDYQYDGFGDYNSLLIGKQGKITLEFDPEPFEINWDRPSYEILSETNEHNEKLKAATEIMNRRPEKSEDQMSYKEINKLSVEKINELEKIYNSAKDPLVKKMIGSYYLYEAINKQNLVLNDVADKILYKKIVDELSAKDPLWNMNNLRYISALVIKNAGYDILNSDKVNKLFELYKGGELSEYILVNQLDEANQKNDTDKLKQLYDTYMKVYSQSRLAQRIASQYNPDLNIKVGKKAPDFTIKALDGKEISLSDYKGKYVMLDFWATWCKPCMQEMPKLHSAYDKFSNDNFAVLSLSFDRSQTDIAKMRNRSKFKMPWDHAFVENGFKSELAKTYEVSGIPKPILVGPNGKIVALGTELRGANLEKTLSRFIK